MKFSKLFLAIFVVLSFGYCVNEHEETLKTKALKNADHVLTDIIEFHLDDINECINKYYDTLAIRSFESTINNYLRQDSENMPDSGIILFIGSSSVYKWETLSTDMYPLKVINRGFGGSTIPEAIFYADKIIFPYYPSKIVFYAGENDLVNWFSTVNRTSELVFESFQLFEQYVHSRLPQTVIYYISIKPSPSRYHLWKKMQTANHLIREYISIRENTQFIDIVDTMLNSEYQPKKELFTSDMLHMNEQGYKIWTDIVMPYLIGY